jgi:hypothetical protein
MGEEAKPTQTRRKGSENVGAMQESTTGTHRGVRERRRPEEGKRQGGELPSETAASMPKLPLTPVAPTAPN